MPVQLRPQPSLAHESAQRLPNGGRFCWCPHVVLFLTYKPTRRPERRQAASFSGISPGRECLITRRRVEMSKILVLGGGIVGLSTAMMLARRGHDVTVFERDSKPLPASPEDAWQGWERRSVAQFRQPHYLHPP